MPNPASPPSPALRIRQGIGEFSPTAAFQLEKNLQHAHYLVAAGMPIFLGLILLNRQPLNGSLRGLRGRVKQAHTAWAPSQKLLPLF